PHPMRLPEAAREAERWEHKGGSIRHRTRRPAFGLFEQRPAKQEGDGNQGFMSEGRDEKAGHHRRTTKHAHRQRGVDACPGCKADESYPIAGSVQRPWRIVGGNHTTGKSNCTTSSKAGYLWHWQREALQA